LNARQGQVRCGRCVKVFNGFQSLERFPDDDTGARLLAAREAEDRARGMPEVAALPDEDARDEPPRAAAPAGPPRGAAREARREARREAQDLRTAALSPPPRSEEEVGEEEEELTLELPPREPPARAWRHGVALLLVVLGVELAYAYRGPLAQRYPVLRPALES